MSHSTAASDSRYELLFPCLFRPGRGFAFPCDAQGNVAIDDLCDRSRDNYLYARAVVGRELSVPMVRIVA
ncbi:MAG TPA: hypothetical protein VIO33_20125 [Burkholderiaceae bacterium]